MLHRTCRVSKLVQQSLINMPAFAQDAIALPSSSSFCRPFSNLPNDYANVKVVMPVRTAKKAEPSYQQSNAEGQTSVSNTVSGASSSVTLQQGAQAGDQQQRNSRQSLSVNRMSTIVSVVDCNSTDSFFCSNIVDVSMGEKTNGRARHTIEDMGEAVLGRVCNSNQSVLIQQTQTRSSGCKGEVMIAVGLGKLDRLAVIVG